MPARRADPGSGRRLPSRPRHHPGYLSARVTLGRALLELDELDAAQQELQLVLKSAPENLAAIRGLAEIHSAGGALAEALAHYRAALALAQNDPELEERVSDLGRLVSPTRGAEPSNGLSLEQAAAELERVRSARGALRRAADAAEPSRGACGRRRRLKPTVRVE